MLFIKSGTLREALGLARDEKMLDGQDPIVVMNGCTEARMHAPVIVEVEVSGGNYEPPAARVPQGEGHGTQLREEPAWPVLLKMYVAVQSQPFRRGDDPREWYVFARRIQPEHSISSFLAKMAEKRLNFVMHVR